MSTLSLAWRNLLRNRRRSLMTLIAMVLGLVAVLLFGGYIRDINYALRSDFVRLSGHLQVHHTGYFRYGSGNPAAYGIAGYQRILALVKSDPVLAPMVVVATPTLQFGAIAGNFGASVSRTVYVTGSVVDDQTRMRAWNEYGLRRLTQPLSLSGSSADTAVIGHGVARVLQLCKPLKIVDCAAVVAPASAGGGGDVAADALPADIAALQDSGAPRPAAAVSTASAAVGGGDAAPRIEILATTARGAPNVAAVTVRHAELQGVKELDDVYVGLHLAQAQKLIFGAAPPQVTAVALQLHHTDQIPAARQRLEALLASELKGEPLEVIDYATLNPFYEQTLEMFVAIFGFVSVLIGAIVLFTVSNTMSMAVVERTTEIGTLRAIGLRRSGIRAIFVTEGIVLAAFGTVVGTACALVLASGINHLGLTWVPPARIEKVPLAVSLAGEHAMMLAAAASLVVVGALSAILPAARAARMNIVDALRHV